MGTHRRRKPKKKGKRERSGAPYPFEFRLKVVKLYLEDGYRSQTAENVIETYRRAVGEYGVSKEMLTDNGRQYTNELVTQRKNSVRVLPTLQVEIVLD